MPRTKKHIDVFFYLQLSIAILFLIGSPSIYFVKIHVTSQIILSTIGFISGMAIMIDIYLKYQFSRKLLTQTFYGKIVEINSRTGQITMEFGKYTHKEGPFRKHIHRNDLKYVPDNNNVIKLQVSLSDLGSPTG